jgi:YHS domain-containing protein
MRNRVYLGLVIVAALFTGCDQKSAAPAPEAAPPVQPAATQANKPADKPVMDISNDEYAYRMKNYRALSEKGMMKADSEGVKKAMAAEEKAKEDAKAKAEGDEDAPSKEEIAANIAKLPEADRALAAAQVNCVVSDHPLGGMGVPVKVEADGKTAFLCCKGCKKEFESNPAKFLAKLSKKP